MLGVSVGVSLPLHLRTEADPVPETSCYLVILNFRTMEKVQKPISSQCYMPSSGHFRIYGHSVSCKTDSCSAG
jgi:hypothetical protein